VLQPSTDPSWHIREPSFSYAGEPAVEARFTVSNGLVGIRGALEELGLGPHPRVLVAGLFDPLDVDPPIPALVPAPDWIGLRVMADGNPNVQLVVERVRPTRTLDMRRGALWREWDACDAAERTIHVRTCRFASAVHRGLAVHVTELTADRTTLVTVEEPELQLDPELRALHTDEPVKIWETNDRRRALAVVRIPLLDPGTGERPRPVDLAANRRLVLKLETGRPVTLTRLVAMVPDLVGSDPSREALTAIEHGLELGAAELFAEHSRAWDQRWAASDVQVMGDAAAQRALRFAAYHLNSAANPDSPHVSVGARGLTGDAYWGHVFWDTDIFLLPFYALTWPKAARAMLMYRYEGLPAARKKARQLGYRGAVYAWEAAEHGEEATPAVVPGPDGKPIEIKTGSEEHHISADVAYAVWQYWQATGDEEFLCDAGAEILLETARFWASRAAPGADGRYHITRVVGPDEYHEDVDDNAYTNGLAQWNLLRGREVARLLARRWPARWAALRKQLGLTLTELRTWPTIARSLVINVDPATGVIEQFAGYFDLAPIDLASYEPRTQPMDVLLGHEATQRSQVIKQADVLMLLALRWNDFSAGQRRANFRYYEPRCGHGSSLSPAIHALMAARLGDVALAERYFRQAAAIDLDDAMGNAAAGVHMATQGGLWQAAVLGFAGLQLCRDGLRLDPHIPAGWQSLAFRVQWQGRQLRVEIQGDPLQVTVTLEDGPPLVVRIGRRAHTIEVGHAWSQRVRRRAGGQGREQK
jgi:trehalose/maltose hydrolase-like predicted phosphorylase